MLQKRRILLILLTFLGVFIAFAQDKEVRHYVLTIEDAVSMSIENNLSIMQSKNSLDLLRKQKNSSWNSVSPSLTLSGGLSDSFNQGETNISGALKDNYALTLSGAVNLTLTPSLYTAIKNAKLNYETGEFNYETAKRTVELNVRTMFYSLLNTKESIESQKRSLEASERTYNSNLSKFNRGQLSELDLLTSQYNYERQKPVLESLQNNYENSLSTFKQILGIDLKSTIELNGTLQDILGVTLDESILSFQLDEIPSVKSAKKSLETAKNGLLASRFAAWGPTLSAGYTYSTTGNSKIDLFDDLTTKNSFSLNVRIPLDGYLPWSTGALSIENQKTNIKNLELQLENARTSAAISVRNGYNSILNAKAQYETCKSNVELMQRAYTMMLEAYNNGSRDLLSLQAAEDNLLSARTTLQSQVYTLITTILNLENTLGIPFGTIETIK